MKKLNVKRVVAVSFVAGALFMAGISALLSSVFEEVQAATRPALEREVDHVVTQVSNYCQSHLIDGESVCGFYKSQEIVKWMEEEGKLFDYSVEEAQALLAIRDGGGLRD